MSRKLIEAIEDIYTSYNHPIYLAKLGELLRANGFVINGLRATIESLDGFTVVQGEEKERTAIARDSDKDSIQNMLTDLSSRADKNILDYLNKIPRNILYAFCSKHRTVGSFFIEGNSPFHYFATKERDDLLEIPGEFLLEVRIPANLRHLDAETASKLAENIKKWIADNDIDISTLNKSKIIEDTHIYPADSLMKKVILAIPANQRHRVSLPLDIIDYLLK